MTSRCVRPRLAACLVSVSVLLGLTGCGTSTGTSFATGVRIDDIAVRDIAVTVTGTTAKLTWISRNATPSTVDYGTTDRRGTTAGTATATTTHEVDLTGLAAATVYYYRVYDRGVTYRFRTLGAGHTRLAFVSDRTSNRREVYLSFGNGENVTQVTTNGGWSPALSVDGTKLAWLAPGAGGVADIFTATLDADGVVAGSIANQTNTAGRLETRPAWSPDGTKLCFAAATTGQASQILERTVADGTEQVVLDNGGINDSPAYSPDGTRLAYTSTARSSTFQLGQRPLDAGTLTVVLQDDARTPVPASEYRILDAETALLDFSASGATDHHVLCTYQSAGQTVTDERHYVDKPHRRLFSALLDGSDVRRLSLNSDEEQGPPVWAPDGSHLVRPVETGGATNLARVNPDGSEDYFVTRGYFRDLAPTISPDGAWTLFASNRHEDRLINLYRVDANGDVYEVNLYHSGESEPSWSVVP